MVAQKKPPNPHDLTYLNGCHVRHHLEQLEIVSTVCVFASEEQILSSYTWIIYVAAQSYPVIHGLHSILQRLGDV